MLYPKAQEIQFENIHSISPAHVLSSCYSLMLCFNYVKSPLKFFWVGNNLAGNIYRTRKSSNKRSIYASLYQVKNLSFSVFFRNLYGVIAWLFNQIILQVLTSGPKINEEQK